MSNHGVLVAPRKVDVAVGDVSYQASEPEPPAYAKPRDPDTHSGDYAMVIPKIQRRASLDAVRGETFGGGFRGLGDPGTLRVRQAPPGGGVVGSLVSISVPTATPFGAAHLWHSPVPPRPILGCRVKGPEDVCTRERWGANHKNTPCPTKNTAGLAETIQPSQPLP